MVFKAKARNVSINIRVTNEERALIEKCAEKMNERTITDTIVKLAEYYLDNS